MVISIHVPKAAGSTFLEILRQAYGPALLHDQFGGSWHTKPGSVPPKVWAVRAVRGLKYRARTLRMGRYQCIHGHFQATKYDRSFPDATKVTWLRDPVERVASHYHYWMRRPGDNHWIRRAMHREGWSLLDFARQESMQDFQALHLDGVPLHDFAFVGVQERFDALLPHCLAAIGIDPASVDAVRTNVNARKDVGERYDLAADVRAEIDRLNPLDRKLYDEAVQRVAALH